MSQALRKLTAILAKSKTTCIFTNQLREKVGVMFGTPKPRRAAKPSSFTPASASTSAAATRSRTRPASPWATPSRSR